jgi:hypothetical protein
VTTTGGALASATQYNTGLGSGALLYNLSGDQNSAFGANALLANTNGSNNTALGYSSLYTSNGSYNTGDGYKALLNCGTATIVCNGNVAVGANAGRYIADGATANNAATNETLLGYDAYPLASGDSNELVIGANAVGDGSNTAQIGNAAVTDVYFGNGATTAVHGTVTSASGLQGYPVCSTPPTALYILQWNASLSCWTPVAAPITGTAGVASITAPTSGISNTETLITNYQIPANAIQAGTTYRITGYGTTSVTSTSGQSNFRLRFGPNGMVSGSPDPIIATWTLTSATSGAAIPFRVEMLITFGSVSTSATVMGALTNLGNTGIYIAPGAAMTPASPTGLANTAAEYLDFSYVTSGASCPSTPCATDVVTTFYLATIEVVKP